MKTKLLICVTAIVILSACSSSETRDKVSGDYDYLDVKFKDEGLKVPGDLTPPLRSNQYDLPKLEPSNTNTIIGDEIRISSPRLVLPLVTGSRVEEGVSSAKVNFDQIDDSRALDTTIWDKVLSYLEQNNIGVQSFDREKNELVTDWVISVTEVDTSWYEFSDETVEQAKRFKLKIDMAPHGRIASLENVIVDYIDEAGNVALDNMDPITRRNNEVDFLNYIIAEYDFGVKLEQTQRIAKIREGFSSELAFNADGESAIAVNAVYNDTWPRLLLVLRKMGFDVIDLDQSSGIMFVEYNGTDSGFWSGMFSADELPIDEDTYRIFVQRAGERTNVTFKDDDSVALDAKTVTDIYPVFKEYMAADNLDI